MALVISDLAISLRLGSYLLDPGLAPEMCAASPTFVALSASVLGPIVLTRQSGLEQIYAALFANVSMVLLLKSGANIINSYAIAECSFVLDF